MIKQIHHQNFLTTPFAAIKAWELFNTENPDLVVLEEDGTTNVAQDYVDYHGSNPILNRACNIALEQQSDDLSIYQEGISGSGLFDPNTDVTNPDGTYKRIVYSQTKQAFYNKYNNPLQIFGTEYIDFPLGETIRNLAYSFRLFTIPQTIFGDRLVPGTITFYDTSLDDNVVVTDDGYQNLIAGSDLFSKIQEVREFGNTILSGSSEYTCSSTQFVLSITNPLDVYADLSSSVSFSAVATGLGPIYYQWESGSTLLSDDARITGSNAATLYINGIIWADSGSYRIMAYNSTENVTSSYANLYVNP